MGSEWSTRMRDTRGVGGVSGVIRERDRPSSQRAPVPPHSLNTALLVR